MRVVLGWLLLMSPVTLLQAQSPFDGTWKIDLDASQPPAKPDIYLLQDGTYRCVTCDPPLDVRADGQDHTITGEPCYDTVGVKVVDDRTTLETHKRRGKTVGTSTMRVSSGGSSATVEWTESCNARADEVTGKDILSRLTKGPPGSHAISGSWRIVKRVDRSENALVVTLKLEGDTFSFADPTGQGYTAKLDGSETPFKGDLSNTMVSVRRVGDNTIEETDKHDGKVVEVARFTSSTEGKTMTISIENRVTGDVRQYVLRKR